MRLIHSNPMKDTRGKIMGLQGIDTFKSVNHVVKSG